MENFNINRFGQALKCHFLVSRKSWIRIFGIYTLVMFVANLFFTRVAGWSYSKMEELYQGILLFCDALWCQLSVSTDEGYT